jgi:tryptophan synthase alpha chain
MSRLESRLAQPHKKSLVCFITAGDPDIALLPELVAAIARAGADAVEVGIPFSDPIADGPIIQASSQRALDRGTRVGQVLEAVADARGLTDVPIVLMTYYNPVLHMGLPGFAQRAKECGADSIIVTDLTPEEAGEWKNAAALNGLDTIFLVAPTSTDARIKAACAICSGFIYCVARTGVTGAATKALDETKALVDRVRAYTTTPAMVGFGIRTAEDVRRVFEIADGAVVGSALVQFLHDHRDSPDLPAETERFIRGLFP